MLDYGARQYDPLTARWNGVDALAEKFHSSGSYNYVLGNPVSNIDPDGRDTKYFNERGMYLGTLRDNFSNAVYFIQNDVYNRIISTCATNDQKYSETLRANSIGSISSVAEFRKIMKNHHKYAREQGGYLSGNKANELTVTDLSYLNNANDNSGYSSATSFPISAAREKIPYNIFVILFHSHPPHESPSTATLPTFMDAGSCFTRNNVSPFDFALRHMVGMGMVDGAMNNPADYIGLANYVRNNHKDDVAATKTVYGGHPGIIVHKNSITIYPLPIVYNGGNDPLGNHRYVGYYKENYGVSLNNSNGTHVIPFDWFGK